VTAYALPELTPTALAERLADTPVLVLPFGTIEWHSHHLPLGVDGLVAEDLSAAIADGCHAVLAPTSYWAVGGVPFPYTLTLPIDVIEPLLVAVFEQFADMGFRVIVAFTGHFGLDQTLAVKRAASVVMRRSPVTIAALTPYDLVSEVYQGDHAGPGETSLMMAMRPELVDLAAVAADQPLPGVIGDDPRGRATGERGEALRDLIIERTVAVVSRLLDETAGVRRVQYLLAMEAAVAALADLSAARAVRPRSQVPAVQTPPYLAHCAALFGGDYVSARAAAEAKRAETISALGAAGPAEPTTS
jgi:creatinine amidohydrolase